MAVQALAVKYRPKTFDDVVEQGSIRQILQYQLNNNELKNCYLFCGGAGTGKTTCARIFANEINGGKGNPIEMDAASNSSVEDVRQIIQNAKTKSLDSEYKIFIIDECHSLSNTAWQAFLKLIEEPPAKSIFIFCTTDPQKIPKTILSRVQRYDFQRISQKGIVDRLHFILEQEFGKNNVENELESLQYIARVADGGMRDAITLMDKCLAFSTTLTTENVIKALGTTNYDVMFDMLESFYNNNGSELVKLVDKLYTDGADLKLFIQNFMQVVLDICIYDLTSDFKLTKLPLTYEKELTQYTGYEFGVCNRLLSMLVNLINDIKWQTNCKPLIQACFIMEAANGRSE